MFITTSITFFLIRLMPGNPIDIKIDDLTKDGLMTYAEARAQAASLFSIDLDRPLPEQYISFLANLAHGDIGHSFVSQGTPVMAIVQVLAVAADETPDDVSRARLETQYLQEMTSFFTGIRPGDLRSIVRRLRERSPAYAALARLQLD